MAVDSDGNIAYCSSNGIVIKDRVEVSGIADGEEYIDLLGHTGGTPTCTEKATCEVCGEQYGEALGHKGGNATCTEKATCEVCGEQYSEAQKQIIFVVLEKNCNIN